MLPWAHSSPQPKRYLDRFSRFCTAHGRVVALVGMAGHTLPHQSGFFPCGYLDSHLITWFVSPPDSASQTAPRSIQPFLHSLRQAVLILYNGRPSTDHKKLHLPMGDLNAHLIHGVLGPSESTAQTASRSVEPFLQGS